MVVATSIGNLLAKTKYTSDAIRDVQKIRKTDPIQKKGRPVPRALN